MRGSLSARRLARLPFGRAMLGPTAGEVLAAVILAPLPAWRAGYRKVRIRDAIDFPLAGLAAALRRESQ